MKRYSYKRSYNLYKVQINTLRRFRKWVWDNGVTDEKAAKLLELKTPTIKAWMVGLSMPALNLLQRINKLVRRKL